MSGDLPTDVVDAVSPPLIEPPPTPPGGARRDGVRFNVPDPLSRRVFALVYHVTAGIVGVGFAFAVILAVGFLNGWNFTTGVLIAEGVIIGAVILAGQYLLSAVYGHYRRYHEQRTRSEVATQLINVSLGDESPHPMESVLSSARYRLGKRALDVVVALLLLVFFAPLMALIASLVKLTSRGPVFTRHLRFGAGGKPIITLMFRTEEWDPVTTRSWKHALDRLLRIYRERVNEDMQNPEIDLLDESRTMYVWMDSFLDAPEQRGRLTELGWVLRRYRLEELPLLFSVLRGDMSLVGPPPMQANEADLRTWRAHRYLIRPGIINEISLIEGGKPRSNRNPVDFQTVYLRHWSVDLDLRILLRSVTVMVFYPRNPESTSL